MLCEVAGHTVRRVVVDDEDWVEDQIDHRTPERRGDAIPRSGHRQPLSGQRGGHGQARHGASFNLFTMPVGDSARPAIRSLRSALMSEMPSATAVAAQLAS